MSDERKRLTLRLDEAAAEIVESTAHKRHTGQNDCINFIIEDWPKLLVRIKHLEESEAYWRRKALESDEMHGLLRRYLEWATPK